MSLYTVLHTGDISSALQPNLYPTPIKAPIIQIRIEQKGKPGGNTF